MDLKEKEVFIFISNAHLTNMFVLCLCLVFCDESTHMDQVLKHTSQDSLYFKGNSAMMRRRRKQSPLSYFIGLQRLEFEMSG